MVGTNDKESVNLETLLRQIVSERIFFNPGAELNPYIYPIMYFVYDHPLAKQFVYFPMPSCNVVMYIHCKAPIIVKNAQEKIQNTNTRDALLFGIFQHDNTIELYPQGRGEMIAIGFKPGGFIKLFNQPASIIQNKIVDLNKIMPPEHFQSIKEIQHETDINQRIQKLRLLLKKLIAKSNVKINNHYYSALHIIHQSKGKLSLKEICQQVNSSTRSVQRSFLVNIGTSPKNYFRINRINLVIGALNQLSFKNWHQIIHDYGYYDQAHFIHDFKSVTQLSPSEFFENKHLYKSVYFDRYGVLKLRPQN